MLRDSWCKEIPAVYCCKENQAHLSGVLWEWYIILIGSVWMGRAKMACLSCLASETSASKSWVGADGSRNWEYVTAGMTWGLFLFGTTCHSAYVWLLDLTSASIKHGALKEIRFLTWLPLRGSVPADKAKERDLLLVILKRYMVSFMLNSIGWNHQKYGQVPGEGTQTLLLKELLRICRHALK